MGGNLFVGQAIDFIRQHQPLIGFVQVKVGFGGPGRPVPQRSDANIRRHVPLQAFTETVLHRLRVTAAAEHIIHNQQPVIGIQVFQKILLAVIPVLSFLNYWLATMF